MKLARWYVDHLGFAIGWQPPNTTTVFEKAPNGSMLELIESAPTFRRSWSPISRRCTAS